MGTADGDAGAAGDGTDPGTAGQPPVPAGAPPPATFTQEQVNAIVAREAAQAKRVAAKDVTTKHGFGTLEDLDAFVAKAKEAETAALSEVEKAKAESTRLKAEAEADRALARSERFAAQAERALTAAGAAGDVARLVRLLDGVDHTADQAAIDIAVTDLKTSIPSLFSPPASTGPRVPSSEPAGGGPSSRSADGVSPFAAGLALAKASNAARGITT